MTVVHVCKYYCDSKVHKNLINNFANHHGYRVRVIVGSHYLPCNKEAGIYYCAYSKILRFFLLLRTFWVFIFSLKNSIFDDVKLVFCHTLVVDGAIGYLANVFFGTPYVIQVRNTDINFYYKRFPFYRPFFNLILENASAVGFVSQANMNTFYKIKGVSSRIKLAYLWPNGVNDFWLMNREEKFSIKRNFMADSLDFIFVGRFNKNKNLRNIVLAHKSILSRGYNVSVTYVGGNSEDFYHCTGYNESDLENTSVVSKLDMDSLSELYLSSVCLVVPSFLETFGLVYLEALSRYCPVICSIEQGIHSLFPECKSIQFVQPNLVRSIEEAMLFFIENELEVSDFPCLDGFTWDSITRNIYRNLEGFL